MGLITPTLPTSGQDRGTEEIDVLNTLTALVNLANGNLDTANLSGAAGITAAQLATAIVQAAGLNSGGTVRRGKSIIVTEETRTNTAYGLMTTPDRVQGIVLPTDGLICVAYQAMFKSTITGGSGKAAIFLGANQLKAPIAATAAPGVQEASSNNSAANVYRPLSSYYGGLIGDHDATAYTGDVTTGQIVGGENNTAQPQGGVCTIFAAAGTYDISVQFKDAAGTVSVKGRSLWVWTLGF